MLRIDGGASCTFCDGISRRSFVQLGVAGLASFGLPGLLRARQDVRAARDTRVILIWLDGGPSHMDTYDLKPNAPAEYRGFWRPIGTKVSGIQISELFPRQAKVADKFSLIRSIRHNDGDHWGGAHRMLTGRAGTSGADQAGKYPSIGAIATRVLGPRHSGMPSYVSIPHAMTIGLRPGYFGGNYLGRAHDPFETEGDPSRKDFEVRNLKLAPKLSLDRLESRRELLKNLDTLRRDVDTADRFDTLDRFEQQAYELVTGTEVRRAFDLSSEDEKLRDEYGRNTWGQSMLLARRLAEAGVTFSTVTLPYWDHHWDLKQGMEDFLPKLDRAVAALFTDLSSRGLLEKVCVLLLGEFSRTPRMNNGLGKGAPGRDHWGNSMSVLIGGGGLRGGVMVGATDAKGEAPVDRPLTPQDLHATIYHVLGVDPSIQFLSHSGRPVPAIDQGEPIKELI